MNKRLLGILLKYGLGLGLLAYVVWNNWHNFQLDASGNRILDEAGNPKDFGLSTLGDRSPHWPALAAAVILCSVCVLMTFVRWHLLVRAQDLPFTLGSAMRLGLIGFYLNLFLPGSVGGDLIKAYFIAKEQSRRTIAVSTIFLDRIIGLVGLVALVAIVGAIFWATGSLESLVPTDSAQNILEVIIVFASGLLGGAVIGWGVLILLPESWLESLAHRLRSIPKAGGILGELCAAVVMYRRKTGIVVLALGMSIASHFGFVMTYYLTAHVFSAASEIPSLGAICVIVPVGMTMQAGVPLPGGVGVGEWAFGWLFTLVEKPEAAGILMSLVKRCIEWGLGLVGYLVYLRMKSTMPTAGTNSGSAEPTEAKNA